MPKDNCIICGKETPYDFETHIDNRMGYVEGMGQLCSSCYNESKSKNGPLTPRNHVVVPKSFFEEYSNNMELGSKMREYYNEWYK